MTQLTRQQLPGRLKVGAVAGLVGGFALFSSFMAIDQSLDIPNGTFYKTIGIPLGLDGTAAITAGFLAHMLASAVIGAMFAWSSSLWRTFQVVTVSKGILTGSITGLIVFGVFFLPIHYFVMMPTVSDEFSIIDDSRLSVEQLEALYELLLNTDRVLWHALFLHVLYGAVMGLMVGFMLHEEYKNQRRVGGFW